MIDAPRLLVEWSSPWREFRTSIGEKVTKKQATDAMYVPGDGRVTRLSMLGKNVSSYAVFACDLHGHLPRNKTIQDNALTALVSEVMK